MFFWNCATIKMMSNKRPKLFFFMMGMSLMVLYNWLDIPGQFVTQFEDQYFEPLLKQFKLHQINSNNSNSIHTATIIPTFLLIAKDNIFHKFWQQQLLHISLGQCPLPCNFTDDKSKADEVDAIVFFLRDIKNKAHMVENFPSKRNLSQPWIMLSFEAALRANSLYGTPFTEWNGVFNRTMMHRTDADVFNPHGFIATNEDSPFLPSEWVLPLPDMSSKFTKQLTNLSLAVAFISNCNAESGRLEYIKEMQKFSQVDVYGGCGDLKCGGSRYVEHAYKIDKDECFRTAGFNYMFYLAFENSICKNYVTEKLYNLMYYTIVPIVLGGADYKSILPPHSYINAGDYTPEDLATYLLYLKDNPKKYNEYLSWRNFYRPSTVGGITIMCDLCVKLHDSSFYKHNVYEDFYKWIFLDSDCNRGWANSTVGIVSRKT